MTTYFDKMAQSLQVPSLDPQSWAERLTGDCAVALQLYCERGLIGPEWLERFWRIRLAWDDHLPAGFEASEEEPSHERRTRLVDALHSLFHDLKTDLSDSPLAPIHGLIHASEVVGVEVARREGRLMPFFDGPD